MCLSLSNPVTVLILGTFFPFLVLEAIGERNEEKLVSIPNLIWRQLSSDNYPLDCTTGCIFGLSDYTRLFFLFTISYNYFTFWLTDYKGHTQVKF